jgi:aspartate-semialdehyde dehydrogenase
MNRIPVAVLGATGAVGQRFVQLLANHPWFEVTAVTGSDRTTGRTYGEGVNWVIPGDPPSAIANLIVQETKPNLDVPVVFSALPTGLAREMEPVFAVAGYAVVTNASAYRMATEVPLLIPEINPDHTSLIDRQRHDRKWSGYIVASPNCSTTSAVLPMKVLQDAFGLEAAIMTTLQAISGAGYPGVPSMAILDNVVPHIPGEDTKLESERKKLLGSVNSHGLQMAKIDLSAQANRVPVMDGHLASVSVRLSNKATVKEAIAALESWQPPEICNLLPSTPLHPLIYRHEADRPQPRLDRDAENGLAWTVGNVRECGVLDLRFLSITHNTLRGAARGAILDAELLVVQGYIDREGMPEIGQIKVVEKEKSGAEFRQVSIASN